MGDLPKKSSGQTFRTGKESTAREVARSLYRLALALGKEIEPDRIEMYVKALSDLPSGEVSKAIEGMILTERFFPSVAEIRELVSPSNGSQQWDSLASRISSWQDRLQLASDAAYSGFDCFNNIAKFDMSGLDSVARMVVRRLGGPEAIALANPAHLPLLRKDFVEEYNHIRKEHPHLLLEEGKNQFQKLLASPDEKGLKQ